MVSTKHVKIILSILYCSCASRIVRILCLVHKQIILIRKHLTFRSLTTYTGVPGGMDKTSGECFLC